MAKRENPTIKQAKKWGGHGKPDHGGRQGENSMRIASSDTDNWSGWASGEMGGPRETGESPTRTPTGKKRKARNQPVWPHPR